jgi:triosephosphate isomerase (TIM)
MKRVVVAGNWKMNLGPGQAERFLDGFLEGLSNMTRAPRCEIVLFPPALSLAAARGRLSSWHEDPEAWPVSLGVQQLHPEASGAFTGENAAEHAVEAGARYALAGHSERRTLFHETDDQVARRVGAALRAGLIPVVCVGETLDERNAGRLEEVLTRQVDAVIGPPALRELLRTSGFAMAYEPVWAIGTGRTATPDDAAGAHTFLRARLEERFGSDTGRSIPILYGGSVRPENATELLAADEVGGLLVGGASLDPDAFLALVTAGRDAASAR